MYDNPLPLTETEYSALLPHRNIFDLNGAGIIDLPNPSREWMVTLQKTYSRVYNTGLINIGCPACMMDGVKGIYPLFKAYEESLVKQSVPAPYKLDSFHS
jgi:hypothetical protein